MKIWMTLPLTIFVLEFGYLTSAENLACNTDYNLEHGHVDFGQNKTYANDSVAVFCDEGYILSGDQNITCLADGTWSNNTACIHIECSKEFFLENGHITFQQNDTYVNDSVTVVCDEGYEVSGDLSIICLDDGTWSNNTACIRIEVGTLTQLLVAGSIFVVGVSTSVAILFCFKRSGKVSLTEDLEGPDLTSFDMEIKVWGKFRSAPVPLKEFRSYVVDLHRKNNTKFADAFRLLTDQSPSHPTTVAELPVCRPKTRYSNILPFDHSRVILQQRGEEDGSDFINANYIPGFTSPEEYIATQGPVADTKNDFWRMIWQKDIEIIVMLTKRIETGKGSLPRSRNLEQHWLVQTFEPYWPDVVQGPVLYGDLIVQMNSESVMSDHIIRHIEIKSGAITKYVTQLHFVGWPDSGNPKLFWPFLNFVTMVRKVHTYSSGKHIVVHCSNGVGRTGIFIAVDIMLQKVINKEDIDVCSVILDMRNFRCNMVKTEEQLIYIFDCVRHFITMEDDVDVAEEDGENQYVSIEDGQTTFDNVAFFTD